MADPDCVFHAFIPTWMAATAALGDTSVTLPVLT